MRLEVVDSESAFANTAADVVCEAAAARARPAIALPTGRTPRNMYDELSRRVAAGEVDLSNVTLFAVDELYEVPRDHPATNVSYLRRELHNLPVHKLQLFDCQAADPDAECARIAQQIADSGGLDLAVLGIGTNGHIAFNEPGSPFDSHARKIALEPSSREAYAAHFGSNAATPQYGLTLGIGDLLEARRILLLADGRRKAEVVSAALEGPQTEELPASALQRHPDLVVVLDREAASQLKSSASS